MTMTHAPTDDPDDDRLERVWRGMGLGDEDIALLRQLYDVEAQLAERLCRRRLHYRWRVALSAGPQVWTARERKQWPRTRKTR